MSVQRYMQHRITYYAFVSLGHKSNVSLGHMYSIYECVLGT